MAETDKIYRISGAPDANDDETSTPPFQIGDEWEDTSTGTLYEAFDVSVGAADWVEKVIGFGADYAVVSAAGPDSTSSATPQDFLTLATGTRNGDYLVVWEAIFDNGGDLGEVRLFNDTDTAILSGPVVFKATDSGERNLVSGIAEITLDGTTKDIIIQYNDQAGGSTHTIRDGQIAIWKVG